MSKMEVMDPTGHTSISWDADVSIEVDIARSAFDEAIKKGYQAFRVRGEDQKGERLHTFDAQAEKILLIPQLKGG
jgi:hypothetical protein